MAGSVCPIFNEESSFIGLWALDKSFNASLGSLAELMSLAEPTLQALTNNSQRRIPNNSTEVGNGVRFDAGVFVMINEEKAPNEELANHDSERAYVLIEHYGIACLKRCERSDPRIKTPPPCAEQIQQKATGSHGGSTAWFKNSSKRSGPRPPSDFDLFEIPQFSLHEWAHQVSLNPQSVLCTKLPISDLEDVTRTLFEVIKKDHDIKSADAVNVFDEYLGAACPKCFGGLTGNLLQTISASSNLAGVVGGGDDFHRIQSGRCASCDSDTYYVVWHGDKNLPTIAKSESAVKQRTSSNPAVSLKDSDSCEKCGNNELTYDDYWKEFTCKTCGFIIQETKDSEANDSENEECPSSTKRREKKKRKYSIFGIILSCLFLFSFLGLLIAGYPLPILFILLMPGVALLIGSFRPYFDVYRGLFILFGGILSGPIPLKLLNSPPDQLKNTLFIGGLGVFFLWCGFKKP